MAQAHCRCALRSRQGRLPACVEACPTGARVFGNLLDPNSEIRWVLANKKVFRLKEDLNTEPRLVARVFDAVGDVPVKLLSQAASRRNITFVIRETDVPLVLGRLHDAFFAGAGTGGRA